MMYALIENNAITRTTEDLRKEFPNTSFPRPMPDEFEGWVKVTGTPGGNAFQKVASREVVLDNGQPVFEYTYEEVDGAKENHLAAYREKRIEEGIEVNGAKIGGDDKTMLRLAGARIEAENDANYTVNWSAENGQVQLTAAEVIALSSALRAHTQACFDAYFAVQDNLADYDTPEEIEQAFEAAYGS